MLMGPLPAPARAPPGQPGPVCRISETPWFRQDRRDDLTASQAGIAPALSLRDLDLCGFGLRFCVLLPAKTLLAPCLILLSLPSPSCPPSSRLVRHPALLLFLCVTGAPIFNPTVVVRVLLYFNHQPIRLDTHLSHSEGTSGTSQPHSVSCKTRRRRRLLNSTTNQPPTTNHQPPPPICRPL